MSGSREGSDNLGYKQGTDHHHLQVLPGDMALQSADEEDFVGGETHLGSCGDDERVDMTWFTPASPYTYKLRPGAGNRIISPSHITQTDTSANETRDGASLPAELLEDDHDVMISASPPTGHHGDFYWPEDEGWGDEDDDDWGDSVDEALYEEKNFWTGNSNTLFGKIQGNLVPVQQNKQVNSRESRAQAKNGAKIADCITKVPLSKLWHRVTELWATLVFLTNVAVAIADIVRAPQYLYYKVTSLVLGVTENIVVIGMWAVSKLPTFKRLENYEQKLKHFQIAENIVHEVLLYPLLVLTIVGFATEKMYQSPNDAFGWTQLILLIIDAAELVITQVTRIYMVYKFTKDIQRTLNPMQKPTFCGGNSFAGYILFRIYIVFVGNIVLLFLLGGMLGLQVHKDNLTSSNYRCSLASGLLIICFILLPIFSLGLFVLANAYWILEVLLDLNLTVGGDKNFSDQLKDRYGELVHGALEFAKEKIPASSKRLEVLRSTSTTRKALYGITELPIVIFIFVYEVLLIVAIFMFSGFTDSVDNWILKAVFLLVFIGANIHLVALMLLSNFSVVIIIISILLYPCTVPLCCKKKHVIMSKHQS